MEHEILEEIILAEVQRLYPTNHSGVGDGRPQSLAIFSSIEKRINELIRNIPQQPWTTFVGEVRSLHQSNRMYSFDFLQLPSLRLEIDLLAIAVGAITYDRKLILAYSTVSNFLTVYFQDVLQVNTNSSLSDSKKRIKRVLYKCANTSEHECRMANSIESCFAKYYTEVIFVPHDYLFSKTVVGKVPYGQVLADPPVAIPVYDFLFGSDGTWNNSSIVLK